MLNITLDQELCTGCGLCLPVCPSDVFVLEGKKVIVAGDNCMECGHCQAACPVEAIKIDTISSNLGLETIEERSGLFENKDLPIATLVHLMRSRRSCRNYTSDKVQIDVLNDLVKVGITAPSGTNCQGWNFSIVPTRDDVIKLGAHTASFYKKLNKQAENPALRLLAKVFMQDSLGNYYRRYYQMIKDGLQKWEDHGDDLLFHGATAAILVSGKNAASCSAEDALLATQNMLLAAHNVGLGSCLIGFVVEAAKRDSRLCKNIELPEDETLYSVIALGYPKERYQRPAGRKVVNPRILSF